jgi:AraC-like DNA-binding protein
LSEADPPLPNVAWTSDGRTRSEAVSHWLSYFAERREGSPINVEVYDPDCFAARMVNRGIGQVRVLRLQAPAQRISHRDAHPEAGSADHLIHFLFSLHGTIEVTADKYQAAIEPGHAMLIDNAVPYVLEMREPHEVIDLIMPYQWLAKHVPGADAAIGKPVSMWRGWAPPLACLMETVTLQDENYPLPRPLIAEQLGSLLALAIGASGAPAARRSAQLTREILQRIEKSFDDPELTPEQVAKELTISKRYLQALLANAGTSFVRELNAVRLDRASQFLVDPCLKALSIGDIAFRCGFLDPAYFARQFRKRFDATPRAWREMS